MTIADAHVHLFSTGFAGVAGGPPAGEDELGAYERLRTHHGIVRALVIGYEAEARYAGNSDYVLRLAAERPWIAPLVFVRAAASPPLQMLRELRESGAAGVAIYASDEHEGRAIAEWPRTVLEELRCQRALISLNVRPRATAALGTFVAGLDGCPILFSHLGLPGPRQAAPTLDDARAELAPLLALSRRQHVVVKFSAPYAISDPGHAFPHLAAGPFVEVLLEAFGPKRLVWGSDFSPALDYVSFAQTLDTRLLAHCTTPEIEAVMGANLLRLLGDPEGHE
jgi:predicted TIM-barrel fold metal-dependent hydrolase